MNSDTGKTADNKKIPTNRKKTSDLSGFVKMYFCYSLFSERRRRISKEIAAAAPAAERELRKAFP